LEGAPTLATIAQDNFQALQLDHRITSLVGRFQDTLGPLLDEERHVEYAFVDGHHEEQATRRYFEQIVSAQHEPAVLVFDDITWSPGMRRAWSAIATDPRAHSALALANVGICLASPTVDNVWSASASRDT
jgi:predicted O-methyltransferase YrrM